MRTVILTIIWILVNYNIKSQGFLWVKHHSGMGQNQPQFITYDNDGNVYVGGNFNGTISYDGVTYTSNGSQDIFIAKYNSSGTLQWSKQLGGSGVENIYGLALTKDGKSLFIGFSFNGTTNVLGYTLTAEQNDVAVARLSSSGEYEDLFFVAGGTDNQVNGNLCIDKDDNLYVAGTFTNSAEIAGGIEKLSANEYSSRQSFIVKFDKWDNFVWVKVYETTSSLSLIRTVTAVGNNIYISGQFSGSLSFTNRTITTTNSARDGFIAKLDQNGDDVWVRRIKGNGYDTYIYRHNNDTSGNVYLAGYFACSQLTIDSTETLNSQVHPQNTYTGRNDMLLIKYSSDGTLQWVKSFGSTNEDKLLNVHAVNNVFVASGLYSGNISFDGINLTLKGGTDGCMIVGNSNNGSITKVYSAKGKLNELSYACALTQSERSYYFIGEFNSDTLFLENEKYKNAKTNYRDGFVLKAGCFEKIDISVTNVGCPGGNDGSLTASPSSGNEPYTYLWSNGQTTQTISNLSAGTYTVTVSGTNGCTMVKSANVEENAPLTSSYTKSDPCPGSYNGSATALPSNGKTPYSYLWSNGKTTQTISNLGAGTYYCTVSDACPTTVVVTVTLSTPPTFSSVSISTTPSNPCVNTATFTANPNGGKSPYTYLWKANNQTVGTTQTITNRPPQVTHYVTVTDACGATKSSSASASKKFVTLTTSSTCTNQGQCTGTATVSPSNEYPPYTYRWDANTGNQTTQTATDLCYNSTGYSVTVTDVYNCTYTASGIKVLYCSKSIAHEPEKDNIINIYPNPANEYLSIQISGEENIYTSLSIYTIDGKLYYQKALSYDDFSIKVNTKFFSDGIYFIRLISNNGTIYSKPIIIKH